MRAVAEKHEEGVPEETPYLSHSRIGKYLHCPEQYRLHYVERLRPKIPDAGLIFGQVVHRALAAFFEDGIEPTTSFASAWSDLEDEVMSFGRSESWETLLKKGVALLTKFLREEAPRLGGITAIEKPFWLAVTTLNLPLVGVIDLVADFDGVRTVIDFKTAAAAYQAHEVALSDQLTAYHLAEPDVEQVALCVLVKTKEPRIDWYVARRKPEMLVEYLVKAELVGRAINAGHFYKRPGKWCSYCDFLPMCLGDREKVRETLVVVEEGR